MTTERPLSAADARFALYAAWFQSHLNQPMPEGRATVDRYLAAIEAEARALPNHPDDGHEHRYTCTRCGVDPYPAQPARADALAEIARWQHLAKTAYFGWRTGDDIVTPMNAIRAALDEP